MIPYLNSANHEPGVQIGHATGVIWSLSLVIKKIKKKYLWNREGTLYLYFVFVNVIFWGDFVIFLAKDDT